MLEKQVVDLESFNNELIKKQETLMTERYIRSSWSLCGRHLAM